MVSLKEPQDPLDKTAPPPNSEGQPNLKGKEHPGFGATLEQTMHVGAHIINADNFSINYNTEYKALNVARYKNEVIALPHHITTYNPVHTHYHMSSILTHYHTRLRPHTLPHKAPSPHITTRCSVLTHYHTRLHPYTLPHEAPSTHITTRAPVLTYYHTMLQSTHITTRGSIPTNYLTRLRPHTLPHEASVPTHYHTMLRPTHTTTRGSPISRQFPHLWTNHKLSEEVKEPLEDPRKYFHVGRVMPRLWLSDPPSFMTWWFRTQGQDEIEIYCQKFRKWSVLTQWNEGALAAIFRKGLSEALKDVMVGFPMPAGLNESMSLAIQFGRRLRERKSVHHLAVLSEHKPEPMQCDRTLTRAERQEHRTSEWAVFLLW
ncbi:unnamed protein product [Ranitomeya imitator]|uniref:Uncharacterized protein n=1 Tax=Ranitomeya imitator TaxID=111125 RepID=A0ABN9LEH9_9NEOB|nr:unnamed protein product [Ranitomeya imitator]